MKIKILAFISFLFFCITQTTAQKNEFADKIYLNNGSLIVGKILYYQPNDTIKLQLASGQTLWFSARQVKKVSMQDVQPEKPYTFKERGVFDALSINISAGRSTERHLGYGIQNTVGFQFNRLLGIGIGLGYDSYYVIKGESNVASLFGEYRGYLRKRNVTEYWTLAAGYGQPLSIKDDNLKNFKAGFMIQPTIGLRFGTHKKHNLFADLGFRWQQVGYDSNITWAEYRYTVNYHRWILRGGIMF